jgi:hypothetical protein
MMKKLLCLGLAVGMVSRADDRVEPRRPVLVELFTSEGCSSCPPADALLEKLDREQPIAGARIIVLSEHVDYWNHLGWADPYSSAVFSRRQERYAQRFGISGPYTPEMVVNGAAEFVGSDARSAERAIRAALRGPQVAVRIAAPAPGEGAVTLEVDPLPAATAPTANVYVVHAADHATSRVARGENRGRTLQHVSIARDLTIVGKLNPLSGFTMRIPTAGRNGWRLIAFVQEPGNGRVWGAAMYSIPK